MDFIALTEKITALLDEVGLYAVDQNILVSNNGKEYTGYDEIITDLKNDQCVVFIDVHCLVSDLAWLYVDPPVVPDPPKPFNLEPLDWLLLAQFLQAMELQIDLEDDDKEEGGKET